MTTEQLARKGYEQIEKLRKARDKSYARESRIFKTVGAKLNRFAKDALISTRHPVTNRIEYWRVSEHSCCVDNKARMLVPHLYVRPTTRSGFTRGYPRGLDEARIAKAVLVKKDD